MITKGHAILGLVLVVGIVAGCATAAGLRRATGNPAPVSITPRAVVAAEEQLAERLRVAADDVQYLAFHQVEWPDTCLGMAVADAACQGHRTLGWWVVLMANGERYRFRTDLNGDLVRQEE